jgi:type VI secretion system ImpC/EvpB family protein
VTSSEGSLAPDARSSLSDPAASVSSDAAFSILDTVLSQGISSGSEADRSLSTKLLNSVDFRETLDCWLRLTNRSRSLTLRQAARAISREIAQIDATVSEQLNQILHHPQFQQLEASWRGLRHLVDQKGYAEDVQIRVLNASWKHVVRDLDRSVEFDQSQLFQKIYSEEFGNPGGIPYSLLIGDYEIQSGARPGQPMQDLDAIFHLSQIAAASFAPFITAAHPSLLTLNEFSELHRPSNWEAIFEQPEFIKWRNLRESPDSRFVGLVMPRVLIRAPYTSEDLPGIGFNFVEEVSNGEKDNLLWGNASYCFASVAMRSFMNTHWPADIRGVRQDEEEGGLVTGLPVFPCRSGERDRLLHSPVETTITDKQEAIFSELGFLPLSYCRNTNYAAFYSSPSIQKASEFDEEYANENARISSMLQYMLCVSRFAHYVKVLGRDKVGTFMDPASCQKFLQNWLRQYISTDPNASQNIKAEFPLRDARVEVNERPGSPGHYFCNIYLQPQYQLDNIVSSIALVTELAPSSSP